jgi:hypothetical protein
MTLFFCPANVMLLLSHPLFLSFFFSFPSMGSFSDYSLCTIRMSPMSAMFARSWLFTTFCSVLYRHYKKAHVIIPNFFFILRSRKSDQDAPTKFFFCEYMNLKLFFFFLIINLLSYHFFFSWWSRSFLDSHVIERNSVRAKKIRRQL